MKSIKPSPPDMHPFFTEINKYLDLESECRTDIHCLPSAFKGIGEIKAILLGADPTNNGVRNNPGLIKLETVFGIGSPYEKDFFRPQQNNLGTLAENKDHFYIQNVCRNYFKEQTAKNNKWNEVAKIWLPHLKDELMIFDFSIPVLVTAEKIMKLLIGYKPSAEDIYTMKIESGFESLLLGRKLYALYRSIQYPLSKYPKYCEFLKNKINE